MSIISVPALRVCQNSEVMYVIKVPIKQFVLLGLKVEKYDPSKSKELSDGRISKQQYLKDQGYQREKENNRVNKFAKYLCKEDSISPTAILVNDREKSCIYDAESGKLSIDLDTKLFNYDGQHRAEGLRKAFIEKPEVGDIDVVVIITSGLDKRKEMIQFNTINTTSRGVKTNLVLEIMSLLDPKGITSDLKGFRKIACRHAMTFCNNLSKSPWKDSIRTANMEKAATPHAPSTTFIESLNPIYVYLDNVQWPHAPNQNAEGKGRLIADIVIEFWSAIKDLMPVVFSDPSKYLLQKHAGIWACHKILTKMMSVMYSDSREWNKSEFKELLKDSGWFSEPERWEKDGDAATYTGHGGGDKLFREIEDEIWPSLIEV